MNKQQLDRIAAQLSSQAPLLIDVDRHMPATYCHDNVFELVRQGKGQRLLGWYFSVERAAPIVTAVWHSVLLTPGKIVDVTSLPDRHQMYKTIAGEGEQMYFLPADDQRDDAGFDKLFALSNTPKVTKFVRKMNRRMYEAGGLLRDIGGFRVP